MFVVQSLRENALGITTFRSGIRGIQPSMPARNLLDFHLYHLGLMHFVSFALCTPKLLNVELQKNQKSACDPSLRRIHTDRRSSNLENLSLKLTSSAPFANSFLGLASGTFQLFTLHHHFRTLTPRPSPLNLTSRFQ